MKKRYLYTALIIEIVTCLGAYLMQYFTAKKMGMLRWVNHLCNKWGRMMDLDRLNLILMLLVSALALTLLLWTLKKCQGRCRSFAPLMVTAFAAVGIYLVWTLRYTRRLMAAYYLVSPILLLGAIITLCCWALAVFKSE